MDASSILEEDIVEICIQKGNTDPLGVLHYLAMESIILFGTMGNLNHASCDLIDIIELQDEANGSVRGPCCHIYLGVAF